MTPIKNIILDLGDVILKVETTRSTKKLLEYGLSKEELDTLNNYMFKHDIYNRIETGEVSEQEFHDITRDLLKKSFSDQKLNDAWNEMILDFPEENVKLMEELKSRYNLFLLSNTNPIHHRYFDKLFVEKYDYPTFKDFFNKAYLSYEIDCRKPQKKIFQYVLKDANLNPAETLFVDDRIENIKAAESVGIRCIHLIDLDLVEALLEY